MASRVIRGPSGRARGVVITVPSAGLDHGQRFRVLGDTITAGGPSECVFAGAPTGRRTEPIDQPRLGQGRAGTVRQSWPDSYPARARELHAEGLSCPKVAEELGVPFATAKFWIWPPATPARRPKESVRARDRQLA